MKLTLRTITIATATAACAALFSPTWSAQDGVSLSASKADAATRVYIRSGYASRAVYHNSPNLPWYAVRAYYFNGPWAGDYYSYSGWADYATRNGISCLPGSIVKGGDGIWYNCQ
jgi:hypothetical protein